MKTEYVGVVENGKVVVQSDSPLPEGLQVKIVVPSKPRLADRLRPFCGIAQDLPPDLAENHDHYLHGTERK